MLADLPIGEPVPFCLGSLGEGLDLHAALIPNPVCTFYMRASGNGMRQHGINDGDLMVIDRSVEPCSGHVVVVAHLSADNEVDRSATSSLAGGVSAGEPGADAQGPGDAGTTDQSPTQPVHDETTRWQQPGGCCRSGGHLSAQRPPD